MREIRCRISVIAAPIMPRVIAVLRVNFGREYLLPDNGDAQLDALRNVGLKDHWTQPNPLRMSDVSFRNDLGVPVERGSRESVQRRAGKLADDVAVVLLVTRKEVFWTICDQCRGQFESKRAGELEQIGRASCRERV